jgi:hypothetical protein
MLTMIQLRILNSVSDDYENVEQIYLSINFEYCENDTWILAKDRVSLSEIADNIRYLVCQGLLIAKSEYGIAATGDVVNLFNLWFHVSAEYAGEMESGSFS